MAFHNLTAIHNGAYKKVFSVDVLDNDAAATELAIDFTAAPFSSPLRSAPNSFRAEVAASGADAIGRVAVTVPTVNGCTMRVLAAGGVGGADNTYVVTVECLHSMI